MESKTTTETKTTAAVTTPSAMTKLSALPDDLKSDDADLQKVIDEARKRKLLGVERKVGPRANTRTEYNEEIHSGTRTPFKRSYIFDVNPMFFDFKEALCQATLCCGTLEEGKNTFLVYERCVDGTVVAARIESEWDEEKRRKFRHKVLPYLARAAKRQERAGAKRPTFVVGEGDGADRMYQELLAEFFPHANVFVVAPYHESFCIPNTPSHWIAVTGFKGDVTQGKKTSQWVARDSWMVDHVQEVIGLFREDQPVFSFGTGGNHLRKLLGPAVIPVDLLGGVSTGGDFDAKVATWVEANYESVFKHVFNACESTEDPLFNAVYTKDFKAVGTLVGKYMRSLLVLSA